MGEFGGPATFSPSGQGSAPKLFVSAQALFGGVALATSGPVPDGETWVLQGADFSGACTPVLVAQWLNCFVFVNGSQIAWADAVDMSGSRTWAGASWRGSIPHHPGQSIQIEGQGIGFSSYVGCAAWGIVLPYVLD
jgi:hypothetical protein